MAGTSGSACSCILQLLVVAKFAEPPGQELQQAMARVGGEVGIMQQRARHLLVQVSLET
jgi:hypothetical protein